jgi:hypothetical protein
MNSDVPRLRLTRYIHPDKIVRPFALSDARGYGMLMEADKGKYAHIGDWYVAHAAVQNEGEKDFLFATDQ